MRENLKINSIAVSALSLFFWWAFGFAKHSPVLRNIVPFGDDPYDAVSSFGVIAAILLAFVSLARAFFPQWVGRSGSAIYVLRAQLAIPLCVLVTIAAEVVAMARHTSLWVESPARNSLLLLLAIQVGAALATLCLFRHTVMKEPERLIRAIPFLSGMGILLAIYPERLILTTPGHLFTVMFGAVLLFASVSVLVRAGLPDAPAQRPSAPAVIKKRPWIGPLATAILIGTFVGITACIGELHETGIRFALAHVFFIGGIYLGLGAGGMLIGYLSMGRLLGFVVEEHRFQHS